MRTCKIKDTLDWGSEKLSQNNIDSPLVNAQLLLAYLMDTTPNNLYVKTGTSLEHKTVEKFKKLIKKRSCNYPVAYLTGQSNFMGLDFKVTTDTLIPRPETEIMTEKVIEKSCEDGVKRVLDIGTGCGNIGITVAKKAQVDVVGTDISSEALKIAEENARRHRVSDRVAFIKSDMFKNLEDFRPRKFDVIVSNPPYIKEQEFEAVSKEVKREPEISLKGGREGLTYIAKIINRGPDYVTEGGFIFIEIGFSQENQVKKLLNSNNRIKKHSIIKDYNGIPRIVKAGVSDGKE
ncbi:MAG: peptide chain release factor N(5)-glutamine methyltransferase [Elusimicrobiota bacterium]